MGGAAGSWRAGVEPRPRERGEERAPGRTAGGGPSGALVGPEPRPSAARPQGGWKPEAGEVEPTRSFSAEGKAQGRSLAAPQPPGRELSATVRGHGDSAPRATSRPGAPAGAATAVPAPERAGPGSRLPAAPGLPGAGLLPAGETPTRPEVTGTWVRDRGGGSGRGAPGRAGGKSRLGVSERARSGGHSDWWELRGGPEKREFAGEKFARCVLHNPTRRPVWEAGASPPPPGPHGSGKEREARGLAGEAGQGRLEREAGGALRRSGGLDPMASKPCALQIPAVPERARTRGQETRPDLGSFSQRSPPVPRQPD